MAARGPPPPHTHAYLAAPTHLQTYLAPKKNREERGSLALPKLPTSPVHVAQATPPTHPRAPTLRPICVEPTKMSLEMSLQVTSAWPASP